MSGTGGASSGQAIKGIVSLVGPQDATVTAHRAGTDGAAVSVRIGKTLIYLGDMGTAQHFRRAWEFGARQARAIPAHADLTGIMPVAGVAEPSLLLEASGSPPAIARIERTVGKPSSLWVTLGRIAFDVRDHEALRSSLHAFQRAERLAARTFLPAPNDSRAQAAGTAARLFAVPARPQRADSARRVAAAAPRSDAPVRRSVERAAIEGVTR